jgi:hypothetical protein
MNTTRLRGYSGIRQKGLFFLIFILNFKSKVDNGYRKT